MLSLQNNSGVEQPEIKPQTTTMHAELKPKLT